MPEVEERRNGAKPLFLALSPGRSALREGALQTVSRRLLAGYEEMDSRRAFVRIVLCERLFWFYGRSNTIFKSGIVRGYAYTVKRVAVRLKHGEDNSGFCPAFAPERVRTAGGFGDGEFDDDFLGNLFPPDD